jgi:hypothetical protein
MPYLLDRYVHRGPHTLCWQRLAKYDALEAARVARRQARGFTRIIHEREDGAREHVDAGPPLRGVTPACRTTC